MNNANGKIMEIERTIKTVKTVDDSKRFRYSKSKIKTIQQLSRAEPPGTVPTINSKIRRI